LVAAVLLPQEIDLPGLEELLKDLERGDGRLDAGSQVVPDLLRVDLRVEALVAIEDQEGLVGLRDVDLVRHEVGEELVALLGPAAAAALAVESAEARVEVGAGAEVGHLERELI